MLKKFIINRILTSTLTSLKGKKRWLAILVLAAAYVAQNLGYDFDGLLDGFVADVIELINISEA